MANERLWVPPAAREKLLRIARMLRGVADMAEDAARLDLADDIDVAANEIEKIAKGAS